MAVLSITIPDAQVPLVVNAVCRAGGVPLTGVLATDAEAARQVIIAHLKATVINILTQDANAAALAKVVAPTAPPIV